MRALCPVTGVFQAFRRSLSAGLLSAILRRLSSALFRMRTQSPYFLRDSYLHVLSQRVRFCFSAVSVLLYIRPPEYRSAFRERTLRVLSARLPVRRQKFCPPKVLLSEHSKIQAFQAFRPFFRTSGHSHFRYRNRILIRLPSLPQFGHSPPQTFLTEFACQFGSITA